MILQKICYTNLKQRLNDFDDHIRYTIPVLLDEAAVKIGPWSGYNVLAQNHAMNCVIRE
jgi:hypothetical protein